MVEYDYGCGVTNLFGGHSCLLNCFHGGFMVYRLYLAIWLSLLVQMSRRLCPYCVVNYSVSFVGHVRGEE